MKAMTYGDILVMLSKDRVWYLKRLYDQLKREQEAVKRAGKMRGKRH